MPGLVEGNAERSRKSWMKSAWLVRTRERKRVLAQAKQKRHDEDTVSNLLLTRHISTLSKSEPVVSFPADMQEREGSLGERKKWRIRPHVQTNEREGYKAIVNVTIRLSGAAKQIPVIFFWRREKNKKHWKTIPSNERINQNPFIINRHCGVFGKRRRLYWWVVTYNFSRCKG